MVDSFQFFGITLLIFVSSGNFRYQIIRGFQSYFANPTFPNFIPIIKMPEKNAALGHFLRKTIISFTYKLEYLTFDFDLRTETYHIASGCLMELSYTFLFFWGL